MEPQVANQNNLTSRFNPRNLIMLFVLFFLLIIIVIVQLFRSNISNNPATSNSNDQSLEIISVSPNPNDSIELATNFELTFNKPINPEQVYIESSPFTPITILPGSSPSQVILTPQGVWTDGISYKIKVLKSSVATDKSTMASDYSIDFTATNSLKDIINEGGGDH